MQHTNEVSKIISIFNVNNNNNNNIHICRNFRGGGSTGHVISVWYGPDQIWFWFTIMVSKPVFT